ncbi:hypothetical protein JOE40_000154 [Arthrobacter sp. PvP102]|uniref:hypothetical protein n=1 Tax=unclassified Arthrobacter TaxID=235627 RepID=UPI001AE70819|nr:MULTISPECIES: hypothetical protein [unclassified Arthrobacter]MBP1234687.1 hypothetical protein [Arthrobacter sp. PvP103]MBP1235645.1 hypothetical protein [Arthrobacter sp. PvP102]
MTKTVIEARAQAPKTRARRMLIPAALLCSIGIALAYLFLTATPLPSVPLGAAASIPGGMASISGIVPLEVDDWEPPGDDDFLDASPPAGSHRVKIIVRITALEEDGVQFHTGDFMVTGLGSTGVDPVWSSIGAARLGQGESVAETLVFEVPDKAVALVLEGPGDARLSLGLAHHTG